MEHRWGHRLAVDFAIRIAGRAYNVRHARLIDLSASGAYIKVTSDLRLLSRVQIAIALPHRPANPTPVIAAYVVRKGKDGFGIEWCEYGPKPVLELLRHAMGHRRSMDVHRFTPASDRLEHPKSIAEA